MELRLASRVVIRYEGLEAQLVEFFRHVPPQGANLKTWSPTVATVIKEACSLLETVFKWSSPSKVKVGSKQKKRGDLKIQDFAHLHTQKLGLVKRKVILLMSPPEYRNPFEAWANLSGGGPFRPPKWWTTHNHLKHDEVSSLEEATVEQGIEALAGLLLTMGSTPIMTRALMQRDLLHWWNVPPHSVVTWALGGFPQARPVILKTGLFAILLGGPSLPDYIDAFSPTRHAMSPLLVPFFARH